MTIQPISLPSGVYYMDLSCTLGSKNYVLTMRYNTRTDGWTCDVNDSTGSLLAGGIALRTGRNALAGYYSQPSIPKGALFVYDSTGKNSDPGRDSFATTHQLLFVAP